MGNRGRAGQQRRSRVADLLTNISPAYAGEMGIRFYRSVTPGLQQRAIHYIGTIVCRSFSFRWPLREFCVSDFRQNQEYHVFNVQDGGLFPLVTPVPEGWDGMRAVCGVNAGPAFRESCFKGISLPYGRRT